MAFFKKNGVLFIPKFTSPSVAGSVLNGVTGVASVNGITSGLSTEMDSYKTNVSSAGGTTTTQSMYFAARLSEALAAKSYSSKILYLVPFFGSNLQACVVMIRNSLSASVMSPSGGGSAGCTQADGLHGDGNIQFSTFIKASQLNSGGLGGIGHWENNIDFGGGSSDCIGSYNNAATQRYTIDLRSGTVIASWGNNIGSINTGSAATNGHYYWQNTSTTSRELFKNASSIGTSTFSVTTTGASEVDMCVIGGSANSGTGWKGRCAVCYFTDGTLSSSDVSDLHQFFLDYIFTPTGRASS